MSSEPVLVHGFAPAFGLCSASPFVLKLCTWLRMAGIPYTLHNLNGPPKSPSGKVPYLVRADGSLLEDSQVIIETLAAERGLSLTPALPEKSLAHGHMVRRLAEDSLYWVLLWERWLDVGWEHVQPAYFSSLPRLLRPVLAHTVRKRVHKQATFQGLARKPKARILAEARADVSALSAALGERDFYLGEPSGVDAAVYGQLAQALANPYDSPLGALVREHPRLVAFAERVRARWWAT